MRIVELATYYATIIDDDNRFIEFCDDMFPEFNTIFNDSMYYKSDYAGVSVHGDIFNLPNPTWILDYSAAPTKHYQETQDEKWRMIFDQYRPLFIRYIRARIKIRLLKMYTDDEYYQDD